MSKRISEHYMEARDILKHRALYVNNLLAGVDLPEHLEDHTYIGYCGVEIDHLDISVTEAFITLTYTDCYEHMDEIWTIDTSWVDMGDEDIIRDYQSILENKRENERKHLLPELERRAKEYGMMLVPNENGGAA